MNKILLAYYLRLVLDHVSSLLYDDQSLVLLRHVLHILSTLINVLCVFDENNYLSREYECSSRHLYEL